jgi:Zn-dependent protease with chaperone function
MMTQPGIAGDVAFFLAETILQSAFFCLLVFGAIRVFGIRHPGLRARLWLMALICPVIAPLVFHLLLPRSGTRPEWKLLEAFLAAPLRWLEAHHLPAALIPAFILAIIFSLDVLRWLLCGLRFRKAEQTASRASGQAARCTSALALVGRRLGATMLPALVLGDLPREGAYALRWPRPSICLSERLAKLLEADELQALLAHELAHLQRRDWLWLLVAQLSRDLVFFNPLAHLAYACFLQATEEAADDLAAAAPRERLALASCLLKVQRYVQAARPASPALSLVHRPADVAPRAERLLRGHAGLVCPAAHSRVAWVVLILACLFAGLI